MNIVSCWMTCCCSVRQAMFIKQAHRGGGRHCSRGLHLRKGVGVVERRRLALQVRHLLLQLKLLPPRVGHLHHATVMGC